MAKHTVIVRIPHLGKTEVKIVDDEGYHLSLDDFADIAAGGKTIAWLQEKYRKVESANYSPKSTPPIQQKKKKKKGFPTTERTWCQSRISQRTKS